MTTAPSTGAATAAASGGGAVAAYTLEDLAPRLEALHEASFHWALTCAKGVREEAEDVLQTAYQKVVDGRSTFDGRSEFKTWLFAIIWRTAADRRRRRAWRRALLGRWIDDARSESREATSPLHRLEASERAERVRRALATLSERQHQVLDLVFYHEHSIRQAAEVLGLRLGTARVHYQRGKAALSERLRRDERRSNWSHVD
ncbi:MAG: RNA polymerase sigma factor [Acidobacteriota bacterium]